MRGLRRLHFPGVVHGVRRSQADAGKARIRFHTYSVRLPSARSHQAWNQWFHPWSAGHKLSMLVLLLIIILILALGGGIFVSKFLFLLLLLILLLALFRGRF
jgi:hypothetical protein